MKIRDEQTPKKRVCRVSAELFENQYLYDLSRTGTRGGQEGRLPWAVCYHVRWGGHHKEICVGIGNLGGGRDMNFSRRGNLRRRARRGDLRIFVLEEEEDLY